MHTRLGSLAFVVKLLGLKEIRGGEDAGKETYSTT